MKRLLPIFLALCLALGVTPSYAQQRPPMERPPVDEPLPLDQPDCHTEVLCICGWQGKQFVCTLYEVTVCD